MHIHLSAELQITRRKTDGVKEHIVKCTIIFGEFKVPLLISNSTNRKLTIKRCRIQLKDRSDKVPG